MAKRFCSECSTFHDGPCSPAALARAGKTKGGWQAKGGSGEKPARAKSATLPSKPPKSTLALSAEKPDTSTAGLTAAGSVEDTTSGTKPATDLDRLLELEALLREVEAKKIADREKTRLRVKDWRAKRKVK